MGLVLRGNQNEKLSIENMDDNFLYLEELALVAGVQGPQGPAGSNGPQGIQGASGLTGPQGAIGPEGISFGSLTYSQVIYQFGYQEFDSQISPQFITQSFTQSFLDFNPGVSLPGTQQFTQSVIFEGVFKTSSTNTSFFSEEGGGSTTSISQDFLSMNGCVEFPIFGPGISIDYISTLQYDLVNQSSTLERGKSSFNSISNVLGYRNSFGGLKYQYTENLSIAGKTHRHTLKYDSINGDYSATVEIVVPLDANASVTSTYSVTNNISFGRGVAPR